ncbi:Crp/Fnr family transcriptional regulator [Sulfuricurvum sp.]|uniref:Crp/Fnr family transcriptional regulator n=1 Tax=Sulfuricurvum sp. TaxID=2025608 RepID=UPI00262B76FD|nr:Crp/Fnr family transcriptional regulator [Sulfuricurvum sp.]MDD3598163.1 Crp/Fnr family transcriptional regulator [Sulfuricurvum sp.]
MNPSHHDKTLSLREFDLFNHLSDTQRMQIESVSILKHYDKNEIVFYEEENPLYFHLLIKGEVSIYKTTASTETIIIHRFSAPSLIAEVATLKKLPYPASCECVQPSLILKIPRDPFLELLRNDPSVSIALIASLSEKIATLERSLQRHSAPNAMAKVARLLCENPDILHQMKGIDIARLLGITPETLSRIIKKLKEEGIIAVSKTDGATILLPDALDTYCG